MKCRLRRIKSIILKAEIDFKSTCQLDFSMIYFFFAVPLYKAYIIMFYFFIQK